MARTILKHLHWTSGQRSISAGGRQAIKNFLRESLSRVSGGMAWIKYSVCILLCCPMCKLNFLKDKNKLYKTPTKTLKYKKKTEREGRPQRSAGCWAELTCLTESFMKSLRSEKLVKVYRTSWKPSNHKGHNVSSDLCNWSSGTAKII